MDVESLSKAELLMLLSILEGELEAQDLVIHTLRVRTANTHSCTHPRDKHLHSDLACDKHAGRLKSC